MALQGYLRVNGFRCYLRKTNITLSEVTHKVTVLVI